MEIKFASFRFEARETVEIIYGADRWNFVIEVWKAGERQKVYTFKGDDDDCVDQARMTFKMLIAETMMDD